jgi:hypothetical protein
MGNGFLLIQLLADLWTASTQLVYLHRKNIEQPSVICSDKVISRLGENTTWCLVESQDWIGADVYQVDCDTDPSDPSCAGNGTGIDPASERMANLYSDEVVSYQTSNRSNFCFMLTTNR